MSWIKNEIRGSMDIFKMKRTVLFLAAAILLAFELQSCIRKHNNGGGSNGGNTTTVQWVNLGLPSGLLWADRNVGAQSPEDYGNYYAWGEILPKKFYDWNTYAYCKSYYGETDKLTKYCTNPGDGLNGFTDNLTTLEASDDAATFNFGDGARTPTRHEWVELLIHTTSAWVNRNGVYGRLLTGPNGKSLFLPAARSQFLQYFDNPVTGEERGCYWSSTQEDGSPTYAYYFNFGSYYQDMEYAFRREGLPVRAVRASQD